MSKYLIESLEITRKRYLVVAANYYHALDYVRNGSNILKQSYPETSLDFKVIKSYSFRDDIPSEPLNSIKINKE